MRTEPETVLVTPPPDALTVNELFPFLELLEAPIVSVEEFASNAQVNPVFNPLTDSVTFELNPFIGETVTLKMVLPGRVMICELGERLRVKLGPSGAVTTRVVVAVCESVPLVATAESMYVPAGVVERLVAVKVPSLATGVAVAPEGSPVTEP